MTASNYPKSHDCNGPRFSQEAYIPDTAFLRVEGELCSCDSQLFFDVIKSVDDIPSLVIDLTGCGFLDSSNLGVLLRTSRRYDNTTRKLTLLVSPGNVLRSLEVTHLDRVFHIIHDRSNLLLGATRRIRVAA